MSSKKSCYKQIFCCLTVLTAVLFLFAPSLLAQETRGTIIGTVADPNGAAIPNAVVKITDVARGTAVDLTTNDDGFYQANYLIPGGYRIEIETAGFKRFVRENVVVQINQTARIDIPLEVGGSQETVTVTDENPPLDTAKADLGLTIDAKRISELPLVHGDPYTLIGLAPGVAHTGSQRLDRPFEPTHIVGYAVDGTRGNRSDLTIDGAPSTATADANQVIASYVPPTDIIGEFKVQTATFDAQFGNTEGGVTSVSIKSGTNNLHGSAYYFAEPGNLAANDFFGNARRNPRPDTKSDRFGATINGPVYLPFLYNGKDKTFFLFGYEGIRDSRPRFDAGEGAFVPTAALRNGDFTGTGVTIYDPLTRVPSGGGAFTARPFAGNIIPANRISPIARAVLNYYSLPKNAGLTGNIFDSTLTEVTQPYDNFTFKGDQNITERNRFFVRGSWYNRDSIYNDYLASQATGTNFIFKSRQAVFDDVHTFDATTVLNLRFGYNRFIRLQDQEVDARGFDLTQLGFNANYNNLIPEEIRRFPRFDFSGGPLGTGFGNEYRPIDTQSYAATLNKTFGRNSLKFGGELRIYREDAFFNSNDQTGQFVFDNTFTRQTTAASGDTNGLQGFAAFLLGLPTTAQIVRRADYSEYSKTYGFFAHDDLRVSNKLTLNIGLRYEIETPLVERNNKSISGFDLDYVQPFQAQVRAAIAATPNIGVDPNSINLRGGVLFPGIDTGEGLYTTPKNTFLPRFGAAYSLNDKTVLRGGFGLFAGFLGQRRGDVSQPGFSRTTVAARGALANGAEIPIDIAAFANTTVLEPFGTALGRQTGLGTGITYFNQNPEVSKQLRFQFGVQRELGFGIVAEAVYVGNYGYNIEIARNINALPNSELNTDNFRSAAQNANNARLTANVANPFRNITVNGVSVFAGTAFNNAQIQRQQLLRPFPQFGDITTTNNDGKSMYHSGQFSMNKRFSQGYTVQASYTFSKWLQETQYLNAGDAEPTRMISDQDAPHRFSMSGSVDLPFGKGRRFFSDANRLVNAIVGGFQVQGVYNFQTGFPIEFGTNLFYNGGDINIERSDRTTSRYFNASVFTSLLNSNATNSAPAFQLRTLPLRFTDIRRDNINQFDVSLLKNVQLNETMRIQLRAEFINALNEPYFGAPVVNPTLTTFGQLASANQENYARRAQLGIKFFF